jgi:hypothetical protein
VFFTAETAENARLAAEADAENGTKWVKTKRKGVRCWLLFVVTQASAFSAVSAISAVRWRCRTKSAAQKGTRL